ncbi:hypothetical protein GQ54DRAFT_314856 [Martensiomyces pterosporus]|nr:hypothetical protein GQ54DRAFT_314856 [Martensiomyces pterosporus]
MKKSLLGYMLSAQAPDKNSNLAGFGNGLIFGQILAVSIVGYETPAITLAWVLYLVDKYPGIQQCVVQENADVKITSGTAPTLNIGTGIAPFSGFLQETQGTGSSSAEFYFGCHSPEYDCLYKDAFETYVEDRTLTKLHTAF